MRKCFGFAVGGMPDPVFHPRQAKKVAEFLKKQDGFIGLHLYDRWHTLLFFETLNSAKIARNRLKAEGNQTGSNIMNVELSDDGMNATVKDVAE